MRYLIATLLALTGCYGESVRPPREPRESAGPEGTDLTVDPAVHRLGGTSSDSFTRLRPAAKTIDWEKTGTEEGAAYAGGAVVVDRVVREDADDLFGVRVRLKNTTDKPLDLEYLVRFHTRSGGRVAGYHGGVGVSEQWKAFTIEPYRTTVVDDFARVGGAEGFRLFVRAPAKGDGAPDSKK